jgi:hypothetical protein
MLESRIIEFVFLYDVMQKKKALFNLTRQIIKTIFTLYFTMYIQ